MVKENGIIAGIALAGRIFKTVDRKIKVRVLKKDGAAVKKGDNIIRIYGPARSILTAERLVLNCMQKMSGIATATHRLVQKVKGTGVKILDTRKTTPGIRILEKEAVRIGGGYNHRSGLYDMILIKDNHVDMAGGIAKALEPAQRYLIRKRKKLKIEIEVRNMRELREALQCKIADRILLDNFSVSGVRKAVKYIAGRVETEVSGGITEKNILLYAKCGVDFISVGALTHSAKAMDMNLQVVK